MLHARLVIDNERLKVLDIHESSFVVLYHWKGICFDEMLNTRRCASEVPRRICHRIQSLLDCGSTAG